MKLVRQESSRPAASILLRKNLYMDKGFEPLTEVVCQMLYFDPWCQMDVLAIEEIKIEVSPFCLQ